MPANDKTQDNVPALWGSFSLWTSILLAYWVTLFASTHIPTPRVVEQVMRFDADKLIHLSAYFVLTTLLLAVARRSRFAISRSQIIALAIVVIAYGAFDELTQPLVGRVCDPIDWTADLLGVVAAALFYAWRTLGRQ